MLSGWLSSLHALVLSMGAANLLSASCSFTLAERRCAQRALINVLVFANAAYTVACLSLAAGFAGSASLFRIGHLFVEAIFVGGLAGLEWRWRERFSLRLDPCSPLRGGH